ncbi:hypothetical protein [Flavimarina sp. Hel_I_48]|nr:hypothetical protein [Flavimarina sp. Hel_I_48]
MSISKKALYLINSYGILANNKSLEKGKDIERKIRETIEKLNNLL